MLFKLSTDKTVTEAAAREDSRRSADGPSAFLFVIFLHPPWAGLPF